jgi:large subunit ribosomal protein L7/L12
MRLSGLAIDNGGDFDCPAFGLIIGSVFEAAQVPDERGFSRQALYFWGYQCVLWGIHRSKWCGFVAMTLALFRHGFRRAKHVVRGDAFPEALLLVTRVRNYSQSTVSIQCQREQHSRALSGAAAQTAVADGTHSASTKPGHQSEKTADGHIERLADTILSLNLLQAKQLSDLLRSRLGIEGAVAMGAGAVTPAALAAMQQAMAAAGGGAPSSAATPAAEAKQEKTEFDVVLEKFDPAKKIQVIKEVRSALGLGLKEAKELVEAAPKVIKSSIPKNDAEALVERLKQFGATLAIQ